MMPSMGDIALAAGCVVVLVCVWLALWRCDHEDTVDVRIIERTDAGDGIATVVCVRHVERCRTCGMEWDAEGRPC